MGGSTVYLFTERGGCTGIPPPPPPQSKPLKVTATLIAPDSTTVVL